MKRYVAPMVLVLLGGAVADVVALEPDSSPFLPFSFSLLDFEPASVPIPAATAWLHLAERHNMGPLADPSVAPLPAQPAPLEIIWPSQTEECVCDRCPALYWDDYCPVCGRYVPGPDKPVSIEIAWR